MGELPKEMSNAEIHRQLVKILEEIRKNSKMVNKKRTGFSKIIMD